MQRSAALFWYFASGRASAIRFALAAAVALGVFSALLAAVGKDPLKAYLDTILYVFGNAYGFSELVVRMIPLPGGAPRVPIADAEHYSRVVHAAFGQRRKTLRNALRAVWSDDEVDAALTAAAIDGVRRGETLDIAEYGRLSERLPVAGS